MLCAPGVLLADAIVPVMPTKGRKVPVEPAATVMEPEPTDAREELEIVITLPAVLLARRIPVTGSATTRPAEKHNKSVIMGVTSNRRRIPFFSSLDQ